MSAGEEVKPPARWTIGRHVAERKLRGLVVVPAASLDDLKAAADALAEQANVHVHLYHNPVQCEALRKALNVYRAIAGDP